MVKIFISCVGLNHALPFFLFFFVSIPTIHLIKTQRPDLPSPPSILSLIFLFSFLVFSFLFYFFPFLSYSLHFSTPSIGPFSLSTPIPPLSTVLSLSPIFLFFSPLLAAFPHLHSHDSAFCHPHYVASQCDCHWCTTVSSSTNPVWLTAHYNLSVTWSFRPRLQETQVSPLFIYLFISTLFVFLNILFIYFYFMSFWVFPYLGLLWFAFGLRILACRPFIIWI